jgi:hypothetical protein
MPLIVENYSLGTWFPYLPTPVPLTASLVSPAPPTPCRSLHRTQYSHSSGCMASTRSCRYRLGRMEDGAQYLPKGTDLSLHSAAGLARIAASLNSRPRKTLGYMTPSEKLAELLAHTG